MADQPEVLLFTDGACSGNPGPGGWAFIMKHAASGKVLEKWGGEALTTNNRMELQAVIEGLSALKRRGVESMICPAVRGRVSLSALLNELGRRGVTSLLLEGGSVLNGAMLRAKLVQRVRLYIAPVLLGGDDAKGLIGGTSPARLAQAVALRQGQIGSLGGDMVVEGDV